METIVQVPKLSQVLFDRRQSTFGSLAALPSNVDAIEAALMFSSGHNPFVALVGPSGWGKTHLLSVVASRLGKEMPVMPEQVSVEDYLTASSKAESPGPLLLDDVQDALGKNKMKVALRFNLERRVRFRRPTILAFTTPRPSRALRAFLPSPRDWTIVTMGAAAPEERLLLLLQMSKAEGIELSPRLSRIIADHMQGNGRTISGALTRLRLTGANWLDPNATLRALGLLDPFFVDNSGWDFKHRILRVADASKAVFPKVSTTDLALYVMLHEASLNESEVARIVGIEPADAYLRASSFKSHLPESELYRTYVRQFIEMVLESLTRD